MSAVLAPVRFRFRRGDRVTCVRGIEPKRPQPGIVDCGGLVLVEGSEYTIAKVDDLGDVALTEAPEQFFYPDRFVRSHR